MPANPTKTLETYALVALPVTEKDIPKLHELSVGVGWMHRAEDWEMMLKLGEGIFAVDEIGRAVASAMFFPIDDQTATIGMVITAPRFQEQGTASWMMEQILSRVGQRDLMLNATHAAYRLYYSLGFRPETTVYQHHGMVQATPTPSLAADETVQAITPEDYNDIAALDAHGYGGSRRMILDNLLAVSVGTILRRGGKVAGFALCRPFGRGHVIGPVIAESEIDTVQLIAPHLAMLDGRFARLDTREDKGVLRDYLDASGMKLQAKAISMSRGSRHLVQEAPRVFALATQALG